MEAHGKEAVEVFEEMKASGGCRVHGSAHCCSSHAGMVDALDYNED
jgi:hypothetical protein